MDAGIDETPLSDFFRDISLVDHHCHGLLQGELTWERFQESATESEWPAPPPTTSLDSPLGLFIRAECATALGMERHITIDHYFAERSRLGAESVARVLLERAGIAEYLVDTGFHGDEVTSPELLSEYGSGPAHRITRLEALAEETARGRSAAGYAAAVREAVQAAQASSVGFKSIIAYRFGLDFDDEPPQASEVARAAGEWLARCEASGRWRLDHPVLLRHLLWEALPLGLPIQMHVGFGDGDITLHRCDPSAMTPFLRRTAPIGTPIVLLHCYPFIREAGILAHVFPHVYMDTSLGVGHSGASAQRLIRDSLELTPFGKLLFASDAYGLPELYFAGAELWRRSLTQIMSEWVTDDVISLADAKRYSEWIAAGNARRVYGLGAADA